MDDYIGDKWGMYAYDMKYTRAGMPLAYKGSPLCFLGEMHD